MLKKNLLFKKCTKYAYIVFFAALLPFQAQSDTEGNFDWQSYLPEWLQNISHGDFPEFEKEIQEMERSFEGVKPVPGEATSSLFMKQQGGTPSVRLYGPAELKNLSVKGDVRAHGPLLLRQADFYMLHAEGPVDAKDIHIEEGIVKGPAKLEAAQVVGTFIIHGPFLARNSSFKGKIIVKGNKAVLFSSKIEGDVIMESSPTHEPQALFLLDGTEIQGNVIFQEENPNNKIIVDKKSHIHGVLKGVAQPAE